MSAASVPEKTEQQKLIAQMQEDMTELLEQNDHLVVLRQGFSLKKLSREARNLYPRSCSPFVVFLVIFVCKKAQEFWYAEVLRPHMMMDMDIVTACIEFVCMRSLLHMQYVGHLPYNNPNPATPAPVATPSVSSTSLPPTRTGRTPFDPDLTKYIDFTNQATTQAKPAPEPKPKPD